MIFCSVNEDGIAKWKRVLEGTATVTRRLKPMKAGKVFAVQPNRCKKAVCYARVIDCVSHPLFMVMESDNRCIDALEKEAKKEGFSSWGDLIDWFQSKKININDTYRIEFEVVK